MLGDVICYIELHSSKYRNKSISLRVQFVFYRWLLCPELVSTV
jgi:hypothetical protein